MNTQIPIREKRNSHWFLFLLLVLSSTFFYFTTKDILYPLSIQTLIPKCQNFLFDNFGEHTENLVKIIIFLNSEKAYLFWILLIYNYGNIYKTYFIFASLTISQLIMAILKILLVQPRPYWTNTINDINTIIKPYDCLGGFGSPSNHVFTSTVFYLVCWKVLFQSNSRKNQVFFKYFTLFIVIIIISLVSFVRLVSGAHSIDQILFGFLLGLCYYVFVFYVINIYANNSNQLLKYIKVKKRKFIFSLFLGILGYVGLFYFRQSNHEEDKIFQQYEERIKKICPNLKESQMLFKDSIVYFCFIFSNIGAWLGLKCEYNCLFDKNDKNWSKYNFETEDNDWKDNALISSKITIAKEIQWNHTGFIKSIFRLIFMCLFLSLCIVPYFLIGWDNKVWVIAVFKVGLSFNLFSFGMFFLLKLILKWVKLSNLTLFTMLRESI